MNNQASIAQMGFLSAQFRYANPNPMAVHVPIFDLNEKNTPTAYTNPHIRRDPILSNNASASELAGYHSNIISRNLEHLYTQPPRLYTSPRFSVQTLCDPQVLPKMGQQYVNPQTWKKPVTSRPLTSCRPLQNYDSSFSRP